ncbi:peptidoglycan hydrolase-like protein with peptidoglycan-binding domain [Luteibacter sp. 621]|uniref:XVIPCD domain-containing protein n=1 Tax=Luteibacter sp. 621 TaxID=3373916 RepID=UPI003D19852B
MGSKEQFIADLYPAALKVSKETSLSVELTLAQAAGETGWGEKILPGTHNLFNIKADPSWHGPTKTFHVWEIEHGKKVWKDQDFRVYGSYEEAIADRAKFLKENPRYGKAGLFDPGTLGNLEKEADALKKAGYATDPDYATNMRAIYAGRTMRHGIELATGHRQEAGHAAPQAATSTSLKQGAHGDRVHDMQAELIALGYAKQLGSTVADGKFGQHTEDAVKAFQRDHHLKEDGIVGKNTLNAMHEAVKAESQKHQAEAAHKAASLADPAHAGHPVFRDALAGVQKIDAEHNRASGPDSHQLAGAVAASAICTGMQRIDSVMLDDNATRVFAVQGELNSPFKQVASVDVLQGLQTPLAQSTQQVDQYLQQAPQAQNTQNPQQVQAPQPVQPGM